jgi:hypothetical protein
MGLVVNKFRGLLPALDRRQVQEPFVLDGSNFLMSLQGPTSAFGSRFYSYKRISHPEILQPIFINDDVFIFTENAVYHDDLTLQTFAPSYTFPENLTAWPWSVAFVGGKYYFAKKGSGLIEHDEVADSWRTLSDPAIPAGLVACTQAGGRLILLGTAIVAYSAIDDGADLTPDVGTGAGFQLTAIAGGGPAIAVKEVNQGFITYLTHGMMFSQIIEADVPFRHIPLATTTVPVSPFCIVDVEKRSHILLARTGFYLMSSAEPQIWQPLIGEYVKTSLFQQVSPTAIGTYKLFFDAIRQFFFISVASNQLFEFDRAFVLYLPGDEWGEFNHRHSQICNLPARLFRRLGHFIDIADTIPSWLVDICFVGTDGYVREIHQASNIEMFTDHASLVYNFTEEDLSHAIENDGVWRFPVFLYVGGTNLLDAPDNTLLQWRQEEFISAESITIDEATELPVVVGNEPYSDETFFTDETGFYDYPQLGSILGVQGGFTRDMLLSYIPQLGHLQSEITLGLFRMGDENQIHRTFSIYDFVIGVSELGENTEAEDWNILEDEEDWNLLGGEEDWGEGIASHSNFSAELIAFADGYTVLEDQVAVLDDAVYKQTNQRFQYTPYLNVFYAGVRIFTVNTNDYYAIKTVEFNTTRAGVTP